MSCQLGSIINPVTNTPDLSAWIADAKIGRYKTIHIAILISSVGHVVLTAASAPAVITKTSSSFAAFIIGLLLLCIGTGFFKANIAPMLAEQNTETRLRVEEQKGERVIVDPTVTNSRIFMYFYFCINVGSLVGQIAMVFTEKYVGSFPSPGVTAHLANWWILDRILARIPPAYSSLPLLPLGPVVEEGHGTFSRGVGVPKETAGVPPS